MKEGERKAVKVASRNSANGGFHKSEKYKQLKIKAVTQILLIISIAFVISLSAKEVKAEDAPLYCCLEDRQGNLCQQYETQGNCREGTIELPGPCSTFQPCKPGCCDRTNVDFSNYQEISCYPNVGIQTCNQQGGIWRTDGNCGYEQCQQACCKIGSQCTISTKSGCEKITNSYGLEVDYKPEITSEIECQNICRAEEKGCCVVDAVIQGENNQCGYKTYQECQSVNGQFSTGAY